MKIRLLSGFGKWIMAGGYCYCLVAGLVACTPDRGQVNVIPLPNDMEIKEKLKHWFIMVSTNRCLGCCLFCEWWDMCKWETEDRRKKS